MNFPNKNVVIIGAGINGLVAANYLVRAGFSVTILERKDHPGGACTAGVYMHDGKAWEYPQGASVFGMMENFVFKETGLSKRVSAYKPDHPEIIMSADGKTGYIWSDPKKFAQGAKEVWGETGDVSGFIRDMGKVADFLREGYRAAQVPILQRAEKKLGKELVRLWISGSAQDLFAHYGLVSEPLKLYYAVSVIESGPVSLGSPYSAFAIPLMASGSVFDGDWGYVKGGLWQVPLELDKINARLGVKRIFSANVLSADPKAMNVVYEKAGKTETVPADYIFFANDPLTAANILRDKELIEEISKEELMGTSGKLIMFFKEPVVWKNDTGMPDFGAAFRHIIRAKDLGDMDALSQAVAKGESDYTPSYFEVYCEGAGDRTLGGKREYELVSIFFKNMSFNKRGTDMPDVREAITKTILEYVSNPEALVHTILETPKDISTMFFFPGGNIDAVDLSEEHTFFRRTYSPDPKNNFYRFGKHPNVFYCAAGAYPCGSVAGTPGYMCAKQLILQIQPSLIQRIRKVFSRS